MLQELIRLVFVIESTPKEVLLSQIKVQSENSLKTFIFAMVLFHDAQKKAQAELDSFLGGIRLVEFEDKVFLPYTVALYKEVMRWHPLLPLGVAHAVTEDDVVNGYFIPKGAIVFGNTWYNLILGS